MKKEGQQNGLRRSLNLLDATAISVGAIIGGIYLSSGTIYYGFKKYASKLTARSGELN